MKKQNCKISSLDSMSKIILCSFILSSCSSASDKQENISKFIGISDYQRAEKFLQVNTEPLVTGKIQRLFWQEDDRLIYQRTNKGSNEFIVADLSTGKKTELFNPINFAKAISEATNEDGIISLEPVFCCPPFPIGRCASLGDSSWGGNVGD